MLISEALAKLAAQLPSPADAAVGDDPDHRARAVLAMLLERAIRQDFPAPVPPDSATCPNCGIPVASESSPYCGSACREQSAFVRQVRRALVEGGIFDPERQASLGQVLWDLLGGGFPRRLLLIPEKTRLRNLRKNDGLCEACGAPGTTFDHIGSACNRRSNLRIVCDACAHTKAFGDPEFLGRDSTQRILEDLSTRVGSPYPVRVCDDPDTWDWRAYLRERKGVRR